MNNQTMIEPEMKNAKIENCVQDMVKQKRAAKLAREKYDAAYQSCRAAMEEAEIDEYQCVDSNQLVIYKSRDAEVKLKESVPLKDD